MKIKIKDIINLKGCYSAYDIGEREIDLPDKDEIFKIIADAFHPSRQLSYDEVCKFLNVAKAIARRIGTEKKLC